MAHFVDLPNGDTAEFPDEMHPDQISSILQKQFPKENTNTTNKSESLTPLDYVRNIGAGAVTGLGKGGQFIASKLTGGYAPKVDWDEIGNSLASPKHSFGGDLTKDVSEYLPYGFAGGASLLGQAGAGALFGASEAKPDQENFFGLLPKGEFGGALEGALFNTLVGKVFKKPILNALGRTAVGGAIGYGVGGEHGAETGAGIGFGLPYIAKKFGVGLGKPGRELLETIKPEDIEERTSAANALNTPITPSEASGRPDIAMKEARYGRVGEGAEERIRIGLKRIEDQKNAINDLNRYISPNDSIANFDVRKSAQDYISNMEKERENAVRDLYESSYGKRIAPNKLKSVMNSDKTIENAVEAARSDPKYSVELKGYPVNSIKTLDYAARKIQSQIEQSVKYGDNDAVRVLTASKNRLLDAISGFSKDYMNARNIFHRMSVPIDVVKNSQLGRIANLQDTNLKNVAEKIFDPKETNINVLKQVKNQIRSQNPEAWDNIVKNHIQQLMSKEEEKGTSFYNKVLKNDNTFNQLMAALDHNPQAQQQLSNMRSAWKNLIDIETPRAASGKSIIGLNHARVWMENIIDMWHEMMGGKRDKQALKFIYTPGWEKEFSNIAKTQNKNERIAKVGNMIKRFTLTPLLLKEVN